MSNPEETRKRHISTGENHLTVKPPNNKVNTFSSDYSKKRYSQTSQFPINAIDEIQLIGCELEMIFKKSNQWENKPKEPKELIIKDALEWKIMQDYREHLKEKLSNITDNYLNRTNSPENNCCLCIKKKK